MAKQRRTATRNTTSGALRSFFHFQARGMVDDGFGQLVPGGEFVTQFSAYGNLRPLLRGSAVGVEGVYDAILQGFQPYVLTVRNSSQYRDVTLAWRLLNARDENKTYNIKSSPTDVDNKDMWLEMIISQDSPN